MKLNDHDQKMLLALQEGKLKTGELARVLEITPRAVQKRAVRLRDLGLVEKPHQGVHRLTVQGRSLMEEKLFSIKVDLGKLQPLIEAFPVAALQAFTRLLLSALIAKAHLFDLYETSWPSFVVGGPTKTGKTLIAYVIEQLLGQEGLIKHVQTATAGELIGRRFQGREGWNFNPSPYFSGPFICLDELDKAQGELQRQALYYLQGDRTVAIEGGRVEVHPVTLVTLNTDIKRGLTQAIPEAYLRRAVVLDTEPIRGELEDIDMAARRLLKPVIRLDPAKLPPSAEHLSDRELTLLRRLLKENVTGEGWGLLDPPSMAILALGRSALIGDVGEAIYQTVWDRLMCAETLCHTRQGWRARIAEEWRVHRERETSEIQVEIPEPNVEVVGVGTQLQERVEAIKRERFAKELETGNFIKERSRLEQGFGMLCDLLLKIPGKYNKRATKPLRDKLKHYIRRVQRIKVGDGETLDFYEQLLSDSKREANELRERYQQALSRIEARRKESRRLSERIAHLKKELAPYQHYSNCRRTRRDEDVADTLRQLGCLEWSLQALCELVPLEVKQSIIDEVNKIFSPMIHLQKPEPQKVDRQSLILVGCDGREYTLGEVDHWDKPAVKWLLKWKMDPIQRELADLKQRVQTLRPTEEHLSSLKLTPPATAQNPVRKLKQLELNPIKNIESIKPIDMDLLMRILRDRQNE